MSSRPQARTQQPHSAEIRQVYERLLAGAPVHSRQSRGRRHRVHLLEQARGRRSASSTHREPGGFLLPLLQKLHGVRAIAPTCPGWG